MIRVSSPEFSDRLELQMSLGVVASPLRIQKHLDSHFVTTMVMTRHRALMSIGSIQTHQARQPNSQSQFVSVSVGRRGCAAPKGIKVYAPDASQQQIVHRLLTSRRTSGKLSEDAQIALERDHRVISIPSPKERVRRSMLVSPPFRQS